ncbi:HI1506-related protein [Pseudomonas sp. M30-35]|uniref:HI1506-related protein n=1 Tax=Pseudomonas sp. M30-35 TaxID=1981174 RepID=UPI000B3CA912|nr:HI1506-related protein [Pseudomonas sp. M30-35]ARU87116.1 hypothetical protein B9K09_03565 [Pseudomonas sp. M30-35]
MPRKTPNKGAQAPATKADKAATAAASATAEQLDTQPAGSTDSAASPAADSIQTVSGASTGQETGDKGQDAPTVLIVGDLGAGQYIEAIIDGDVNVLPLAELNEPLLREVGKFVEIEQYDVLPPEQLILQIEQKVGIEPLPYPSGVSDGDDPLAAALNELSVDKTANTSVIDAAASAALTDGEGADNALDDDGDIEGLWITATSEQGFRRCGFRFTREGFAIALSALTKAQIEQLEGEPNLKVERGIFSGRAGAQ